MSEEEDVHGEPAAQAEEETPLWPSQSLIEAASWSIASELVRRDPGNLLLRIGHPGDGQYDCLRLVHPPMSCDFNRQGRLHFWQRADGVKIDAEPIDIWPRMIREDSQRELLDEICSILMIRFPDPLPPGTRPSLAYRLIAALLRSRLFGPERWSCVSGYLDTSGWEPGVSQHLFKPFPALERRLKAEGSANSFASQLWFILRAGTPVLCLHEHGETWFPSDAEMNFGQEYEQTRNLTAVLARLEAGLPK